MNQTPVRHIVRPLMIIVVSLFGFVFPHNISAQTQVWTYPDRPYRMQLRIDPSNVVRLERPVDVPVDFNVINASLGISANPDIGSIKVTETNQAGTVIDANVTYQYDSDSADPFRKGTLMIMLTGQTSANQIRNYTMYFSTGTSMSPPNFTWLISGGTILYEGQESSTFGIQGANLTYHKMGAGFARILDRDGHDWIGYKPTGGSSGNFRGIPNLIYPEGDFHPGGIHSTTTSKKTGALKHTIESNTSDGLWSGTWEIYPTFARMTITKNSHAYWFLYEGTPGGLFDAADYVVDSTGTKTPVSQSWSRDLPGPEWVYFGDETLNRVLFMVHEEDDSAIDSYRPMDNAMTVFGFGRNNNTPLITQVPAHIVIGFVESKDATTVRQAIDSSYKPFTITTAAPEKYSGSGCTLKAQGDADCDNDTDIVDFEIFRKEYVGVLTTKSADFDASSSVNLADFQIWRTGYFH